MDTMKTFAEIETVMDRATLDAFVDGALTPEDAAAVVLHLADCPTDQRYVDVVMETNAVLAAAYADPLHEAVPERLRATIFPDPAPRVARPGRFAVLRPRQMAWGALAASLALAVGLALGARPDRGVVPTAGLGDAEPHLQAALESRPSGPVAATADGTQITLITSFFAEDGRPCRQFEILDAPARALTEGLACRNLQDGWTSEIVVASRLAAPRVEEGSFAPASGAGDEAFGAALDRLGAGMALTAAEEAALLDSDWAR